MVDNRIFYFFVSKYKSALPSSPDNISNSINLKVEFSRNHNFSRKKVHLTLRKRKTSRISFCDIKNLDNFHLLRAKVLVGTISVINNVLWEEKLSSIFHSFYLRWPGYCPACSRGTSPGSGCRRSWRWRTCCQEHPPPPHHHPDQPREEDWSWSCSYWAPLPRTAVKISLIPDPVCRRRVSVILQAGTFFWILEIAPPRTSSVTQEAPGRRALSGASDAGWIPEKSI